MCRLAGALLALLLSPLALLAAEPAKVSYYRDVRPIVVQHCQGCHQPAKSQGSYVLTDLAAMKTTGESEKPPIVPGKPNESNLLAVVHVQDGKAEMPKNREPLSAKQIETIRQWIAAGAEDDTPAAAKGPLIDD